MIDEHEELTTLSCVVLGAGGFVGTNLCRALVGRVRTLRAFGRRQNFPDALNCCDWINGDFADTECLKKAVAGCDVVFHLVNATTPESANLDKVGDLYANVANTIRLLDICRSSGVRRLIFVSSGGTVYGIPEELPTPETAATNPITSYGISKLTIEKYLGLYEYLYGLEYRVLRVSNPFGPYQLAVKNQGVIAAFLQRALEGKQIELWGDGNVVRDYIFIDDVIDALIKAAVHRGSSRVFNVGSKEGRSLNELLDEIESILSVRVPTKYLPGRLVDIPVSILDNELAKTELGWMPKTKFIDGLHVTLDWMRLQNDRLRTI